MMRKRSVTLGVIGSWLWFGISAGVGCGSSSAGLGGATHAAGVAGAAGRDEAAGRGPAGADAGVHSGGALSVAGGAGGAGAAAPVAGGGSAGHTGISSGGASGGSASAGASGHAAGGSATTDACDQPGLVWKSANKTNYTSYPEPGSDECVKFSGCLYEGLFAACEQKRSLEWVKSHNVVAAFPDLKTLELHDLCLKSGNKKIVVTVYDTCGDSDCDGCCTKNKANKDELIDIESFTDARWGVPDGPIEWADLGPTQGSGCN